ncbi:MAG: Gfo/Idh/MocA family oxidoreductase [Bradyrhizobium sp.]
MRNGSTLHHEHALAALARGCHIVVEKPLATTRADARATVAATVAAAEAALEVLDAMYWSAASGRMEGI